MEMKVCKLLRNVFKEVSKLSSVVRCSSSMPRCMKSWQIHKYGDADDLTLETVQIPIIIRPSDALIEVKAASINPIDTLMIGGYGSTAINALRRVDCTLKNGSELPLTLGRDFSGMIVSIGGTVDSKKFNVGDEVWGAVKASYQGSFSQYIVVPSSDLSLKPQTLPHTKAASFPYVASTTWAALSCYGKLKPDHFRDKKVLILGGSGGVGTFAIQLFRAWNAEVTTTVSSDFLEKAAELGATNVVDYKQMDAEFQLVNYGKYDLIYDLIASKDLDVYAKLLKPNLCSRYVTIVNPFLRNVNDHGVLLGLARSGVELTYNKLKGLRHGGQVSWGVFYPNAAALDAVAKLIDDKKLVPVIGEVFPFDELPSAMKKVLAKHNRGKTVIDYDM